MTTSLKLYVLVLLNTSKNINCESILLLGPIEINPKERYLRRYRIMYIWDIIELIFPNCWMNKLKSKQKAISRTNVRMCAV